MSLLEIRHVTKRFDDFVAVDDVSLEVNNGEFFTLLGPSGCGKTSLLRMIAGFDDPDAGQIILDGVDMANVPPEKRSIHTVFQSYALFPHMTVAENVAFPLKMLGLSLDEIKSGVTQALGDVRLTSFRNRYPHELSGGQKQRVALARGLVNRPHLLLLDEPLGALDEKLSKEMQVELINLQSEVGVAFLFVTHDQNVALALSDRIAVMNQGRIEQIDEPSAIYNFPVNRFVADFVGKINMMKAKVTGVSENQLKLEVIGLGEILMPAKENIKLEDNGVIAIRPELVSISHHRPSKQSQICFTGNIHDFLYVGNVTTYIVILPNGSRIESLLPNTLRGNAKPFSAGDSVYVSWPYLSSQFLPD